MTSSSGFHMPGGFYSDSSSAAASNAHVFHASSSSTRSACNDASTTTPNKKRGRGGSGVDALAAGRFSGTQSTSKQHTPTRTYAIAGNLDTPSGGDSGLLDDSIYSESNYRTALGSKRSRDDADDAPSSSAPTSLFQYPDQQGSPSRGWGTAAFSTLGGVVGRVWEFCKAGAFQGFFAGGGQGFAMTAEGAVAGETGLQASAEYNYSLQPQIYDEDEQRVPGTFPMPQADRFRQPIFETQEPDDSRASTPGPAAKRRQTGQADELGKNWVLVKDAAPAYRPPSSTPRKSGMYRPSPRNRKHAPSVTTGRRITTTPGSASSRRSSVTAMGNNSYLSPYDQFDEDQQPNKRPASSASFASPRPASPSKIPVSHGSHAIPTTSNTATVASAASPSNSMNTRSSASHRRRGSQFSSTPSHRRNLSAASTASSRADEVDVGASPRLDAEAKHLAARRKMEERDADVRIAAFNKRLQDMIRQGKEALGTTIEVDDGAAGGWVDED